MYRIVPIFMTLTAIGFHFYNCEWEFYDSPKDIPASRSERIIFYRHRTYHRRGDHLPDNVLLLARPTVSKDEAHLYGVLFPALLVGGSALVFYVNRE